jgi:dihydroorotase
VPLDRLLSCVTARPAELLGLEGGTLSVGARADFAIADLDAPWVVHADTLRSKSQNAAIDKRKVQGQVLACYVDGEVVFEL